ncbi:hypothetical protein BC830DRAFT_1171211 [Chytriomyces sp. MP71]|nr:hypothetical protein BC830DRAFT_1171211 [Chytriomyces sp. MP71]
MAGKSINDKEASVSAAIAGYASHALCAVADESRELLHPENGKIVFHGGIFAIAMYLFAAHGDLLTF